MYPAKKPVVRLHKQRQEEQNALDRDCDLHPARLAVPAISMQAETPTAAWFGALCGCLRY